MKLHNKGWGYTKIHRHLIENGQKNEEGNYKDGKADGKYTSYHKNGQKLREGTFKDGEWYVINGWNKDGELLVKDGNGKYTLYYENGQKASEGNYKDGESVGLWTYWWENGQTYKKQN